MQNSATYKINKHLVLVGMMGVGKSTYGKKVANILKIPFVDIDILIENEIGHSIKWIFENVGEEKFRKIEENKIIEILNGEEISVVALGGGAFLNERTRDLVKEKAISLWLKSSPEVIYNRVSVRKDRPLLEGTEDKLGKIIEIMNDREKFYKQADISAFSDGGNQKEVAMNIIESLKKFINNNK